MTPWLDDGDVRLFHGDALETLRGLPDGSVDCVVTSPPYWGLRDYGTGEWAGGDPDCDHVEQYTDPTKRPASGGVGNTSLGRSAELAAQQPDAGAGGRKQFRDVCGKCGATRIDQQLGLEPTPDLFVTRMVAVFREVRRVLADHGTCWVNLGDSYSQGGGAPGSDKQASNVGSLDTSRRAADHGGKPKDLVGIPWRVAFALQADGWYLRSDIIWAKPNPMPESVTDRPTKAHEYVFLLTKRPRYWFDTEAVREKYAMTSWTAESDAAGATQRGQEGIRSGAKGLARAEGAADGTRYGASSFVNAYGNGGRNVRSVWQIATQPYPEAHFATFPEELARRCILAGCPTRVCRVCGKPSERIVERVEMKQGEAYEARMQRAGSDFTPLNQPNRSAEQVPIRYNLSQSAAQTVGWSDCGHNNWRPGLVLDPFIGSGTVAKVARDHGRHAIGIDLSADYLELAARRLQQLSLLADPA